MTFEARTYELLVRRMTWEAEDVLSVDLVHPDCTALPSWSPGAHVDVFITSTLIRQYSLCSRPEDRHTWTIAVLRESTSSGGSQYIHEVLRPGMTVQVSTPRNRFPLEVATSYLFIAGGIGITPLLPMIDQVARAAADWELLFGGRRRASMAFLERLVGMGSPVVVRPEDEYGLLDLEAVIKSQAEDAAIYCCGPEPLIRAVEETCYEVGRAAPYVERFTARPGAVDKLQGQAVDNTEFDVLLNRSGQRITVQEGQSIVEALDEHNVYVPTSCVEGYCGTCETVVLAGVPEHRDDYLTDDEKASNARIMLCCSRSRTPELELDL